VFSPTQRVKFIKVIKLPTGQAYEFCRITLGAVTGKKSIEYFKKKKNEKGNLADKDFDGISEKVIIGRMRFSLSGGSDKSTFLFAGKPDAERHYKKTLITSAIRSFRIRIIPWVSTKFNVKQRTSMWHQTVFRQFSPAGLYLGLLRTPPDFLTARITAGT